MKKILSILGSIGIVTTASSSLVACNPNSHTIGSSYSLSEMFGDGENDWSTFITWISSTYSDLKERITDAFKVNPLNMNHEDGYDCQEGIDYTFTISMLQQDEVMLKEKLQISYDEFNDYYKNHADEKFITNYDIHIDSVSGGHLNGSVTIHNNFNFSD
jgi:hypothetical protein